MRVATLALNLPGPAACSRLRALGFSVTKVEPPAGDPMQHYCPQWYAALHEGVEVRRLDLKQAGDRAELDALLDSADVLVTAQRPAALDRLGLSPAALQARHSRLCVVRITGHPAPRADVAGHDLTYQAMHGLVRGGELPASLVADMAGAERVVSTALALLLARAAGAPAGHADVALEDAAAWLAMPLRFGLTAPGAMLGGGLASYHCYATRDGFVAVAALEAHFAQRLAEAFGLAKLEVADLAERFAQDTSANWERWAQDRDLPLVAIRNSPTQDHP